MGALAGWDVFIPDTLKPLQGHFILQLQKFCNLEVHDKITVGRSDASDKEHTVMGLCGTEQTSFMQSDILLFLLLLFGKGHSPSLTSISAAFCGGEGEPKPSTNNKQCNLGNNIMQHQVVSVDSKIFAHIR